MCHGCIVAKTMWLSVNSFVHTHARDKLHSFFVIYFSGLVENDGNDLKIVCWNCKHLKLSHRRSNTCFEKWLDEKSLPSHLFCSVFFSLVLTCLCVWSEISMNEQIIVASTFSLFFRPSFCERYHFFVQLAAVSSRMRLHLTHTERERHVLSCATSNAIYETYGTVQNPAKSAEFQ